MPPITPPNCPPGIPRERLLRPPRADITGGGTVSLTISMVRAMRVGVRSWPVAMQKEILARAPWDIGQQLPSGKAKREKKLRPTRNATALS